MSEIRTRYIDRAPELPIVQKSRDRLPKPIATIEKAVLRVRHNFDTMDVFGNIMEHGVEHEKRQQLSYIQATFRLPSLI